MAATRIGRSFSSVRNLSSLTTSCLLSGSRRHGTRNGVSRLFSGFAISRKGTRTVNSMFTDIYRVGCQGQLNTTRNMITTGVSAKEHDEVSITFIDRDGDKTTVVARVGDSLLDVAKDNDIDLEGACEGTLACSTCHLIFDPEQFESMPLDPPSEEELDMLDLAYGLTDTSRLGCQILVTKELDGLTLTVPSGTSDARLA